MLPEAIWSEKQQSVIWLIGCDGGGLLLVTSESLFIIQKDREQCGSLADLLSRSSLIALSWCDGPARASRCTLEYEGLPSQIVVLPESRRPTKRHSTARAAQCLLSDPRSRVEGAIFAIPSDRQLPPRGADNSTLKF
jgi:hypothetical protein